MIPANYQIRLAREEDIAGLPAIEKIGTRQFEQFRFEGLDVNRTCSIEDLSDAQREKRLWVAAEDQDNAVGFAYVRFIQGQPHLEEIDVLPLHGRKGLGTALINTVVAWAKKNNYTRLSLSTFRSVAWNMPFYQRLGFTALETKQIPPEFQELKEREKSLGLPMEKRVIMFLEL
jgi:GNAT superfamily N-acetyltransferase